MNDTDPSKPLKNRQHERMVMDVFSGMLQREAFLRAYPKSKKWKRASVDTQASRIWAKPEMKARYNYFLEEQRRLLMWDKERMNQELVDLLSKTKEALDLKTNLSTLKEISVFNDLYTKVVEKDPNKGKLIIEIVTPEPINTDDGK